MPTLKPSRRVLVILPRSHNSTIFFSLNLSNGCVYLTQCQLYSFWLLTRQREGSCRSCSCSCISPINGIKLGCRFVQKKKIFASAAISRDWLPPPFVSRRYFALNFFANFGTIFKIEFDFKGGGQGVRSSRMQNWIQLIGIDFRKAIASQELLLLFLGIDLEESASY